MKQIKKIEIKKSIFLFMLCCINGIIIAQIPQQNKVLLKDWKRINLENLGNIDLPPNMEIQGGNYKKMMEKGKAEYGISASKVIFQQKELNKLNKNSLNTYARVFIRTEQGSVGDYEKLKTGKITVSDLESLNSSYKNEIQQSAINANTEILEWYTAKKTIINGMNCMTLGYKRRLGQNKPVKGTMYLFQNNDRMHILTFEHRISDSEEWEPTFANILKSYRITNIK
jgi:hypothetical protein